MKSEDPQTMWAVKIKRKNKRLLQDLVRAFLVLLGMALFFTTCYGIDRLVKKNIEEPMRDWVAD